MDNNFDQISQLRDFFASYGFHPKKQFGQNFLIDKNYIQKMIDAAELQQDDQLLEIGPGGGILTRSLIATKLPVLSVEIDNQLVAMAKELIGSHENWHLIHADVMHKKNEINPQVLQHCLQKQNHNVVCIANLPYAITTPFLITLMGHLECLRSIVVLIQDEIADKILARTNQKEYGILSVISQVWGEPSLVKKVPPGVFWPKPKVDSAIIKITKKSNYAPGFLQPFSHFVKDYFQQRRKKLFGQMKKNVPNLENIYNEIQLSLEARPENVSPNQWVDLFQKAKEQKSQ